MMANFPSMGMLFHEDPLRIVHKDIIIAHFLLKKSSLISSQRIRLKVVKVPKLQLRCDRDVPRAWGGPIPKVGSCPALEPCIRM